MPHTTTLRGLIPPARLILALMLPAASGCGAQQMARQPRADPYEASPLFDDGKAARHPPPGTLARGQLRKDALFFEGRVAPDPTARAAALFAAGAAGPLPAAGVGVVRERLADVFPFPVKDAVVARGRQRYEIYCIVCHGPAGDGDGMVVAPAEPRATAGFDQRRYTRPPSYHSKRLRDAPVGHFFDVVTRGYGAMPELSSEVPVRDRWAVAAYIRVLQASRNVSVDDLSPDEREKVRRGEKGGRP